MFCTVWFGKDFSRALTESYEIVPKEADKNDCNALRVALLEERSSLRFTTF